MDVALILLAVSLILFFGFFAEWIFKKISIPDVLFLIILGFILGPYVLNYVGPEDLLGAAPIFITFTLVFLIFDGAFNIRLSALVREFSQSFVLTLFNFIISTVVVSALVFVIAWAMKLNGFTWSIALLTGFLLGGVSSSFAIPVLKQMNISEKLYSLLTLESALTDVFCIVFSLTVIEAYKLGSLGLQGALTNLTAQFAVAGLVGLIGGVIWIILIIKVFKEHNYMMTIAYLLLIYFIAEFLKGNGAIAALFFGLMLKNSKQLSSILKGIVTTEAKKKKKALKGDLGVSVTTPSEEFFYHQISFFLKTFFFVYIGLLLDLSDWKALTIGIVLSVVIMIARSASNVLTRRMEPLNRTLVTSVFARGLAAAAIAQLAIIAEIPHAIFIAKITYVVITGTIILSSIKVFFVKRRLPEKNQVVEVHKKKRHHKKVQRHND